MAKKQAMAQKPQQQKHAINPLIDCVFKALLGNKNHMALLINFLAQINWISTFKVIYCQKAAENNLTQINWISTFKAIFCQKNAENNLKGTKRY